MDYHFNKIYIIESLRDNDLKTGTNLYDALRYDHSNGDTFAVEMQKVKNKAGLFLYFNIIDLEIRNEGVLPLLQFEMHGDTNGMQLNSGDIIPWEELFPFFQKLNISSKNNLIVVLALCKGGNSIGALGHYITQPAPFAALVYSFETLYNSEIDEGFRLFFESLFKTGEAGISIDKLNNRIKDHERRFHWISCESIFKQVFCNFMREYKTRKFREERVNESVTNFRNLIGGRDFEIKELRKMLKENYKTENQGSFFEEVKRIFLLTDQDNNRRRFPISFNDILSEISRDQCSDF